MAIKVPELVQKLGLAELTDIDHQELMGDFMVASVVGMADGDLAVLHQPYSGDKAELYGEVQYSTGKVAKTVGKAALDNGTEPGVVYDFQGFAAQYMTVPGNPFEKQESTGAVRIYPAGIMIDDNPLPFERPPSLIVDYGACLTGRSYIADQMDFLDLGERPFVYSPLARSHFTNQALLNTYDSMYGEGIADVVVEKRLYVGREDGIAAATDEIIRSQEEHGVPTEIADVILCTGAQHASAEDLRQGVSNARQILMEGGILVIRGLSRPAEDEVGADAIADWAYEAGFQESDAIRYEASTGNVVGLILSGHFGDREFQSIVLPKR